MATKLSAGRATVEVEVECDGECERASQYLAECISLQSSIREAIDACQTCAGLPHDCINRCDGCKILLQAPEVAYRKAVYGKW